LALKCDLVIVVGSENSSNGMRLVEAARRVGARVERVDDAREIEGGWLVSVERVGVTSGAAVPENLVQAVMSRLEDLASGAVEIESMPIVDEGMYFRLPALLRRGAERESAARPAVEASAD
jgi:4-hydroxy-3-methylbut-2-enyl diphosphate reductase